MKADVCVRRTESRTHSVRAPEIRWSLGSCLVINQSFRGLLETASHTGDAVEIVSSHTMRVMRGPCPSVGARGPRGHSERVRARRMLPPERRGARCARHERETGSDPITQMECVGLRRFRHSPGYALRAPAPKGQMLIDPMLRHLFCCGLPRFTQGYSIPSNWILIIISLDPWIFLTTFWARPPLAASLGSLGSPFRWPFKLPQTKT